jgi:DNA-binding FadR family transcriptional regulator
MADGVLVPGSVLPPEAELARHYGVSRGTVREALRTLSAQGLIVTRPGVGGGSFVTNTGFEPGDRPVQPIASIGSESHLSIPEIIAARALFDIPSTKEAARTRTAKDISVLRDVLNMPYDGLRQSDSFELHWKFHDALYRIGNPLIAAVAYPLARYAQQNYFKYYTKESAAKSHADHEEIFSAISVGDASRAEASMMRHLERLELVHGKAA